jgi:DNA-binding GntR family transcriptional regulator
MACHDRKLSNIALLVLGEVFSLADENGVCWPSNNHFEDLFNVSQPTVSKAIADLKRTKWISTINDKKSGLRIIYLNLAPLKENLYRGYKKFKKNSCLRGKRKLLPRETYRETNEKNKEFKNFLVDNFLKGHTIT